MSKNRIAKRSKVKPFIKVINYNHLMPTRYTLEIETLKNAVTSETFKEPTQREEAKKAIKKTLEEKYNGGKNKWFFTREYPWIWKNSWGNEYEWERDTNRFCSSPLLNHRAFSFLGFSGLMYGEIKSQWEL